MRLRTRILILCIIGILAVGSTALGYYYYVVYSPPLQAAETFMSAMQRGDEDALSQTIVMSVGLDSGKLRQPEESDLKLLLAEDFQKGRILEERRREGKTRDFYYLVYREPDGQVYAMVVTKVDGVFKVVIPERALSLRHRYLWEYAWTN